MSWLDRLVGRTERSGGPHRPRWDGTAGTPRSSNAASSHHLAWVVPTPPPGGWVRAEAMLEVRGVPAGDRLRFWALQVSFEDRGRRAGGAHLGLQWHRQHPGGTAVNWGGYGPDGRELTGSRSALPSATGNVNTRDLAWEPGRAYRLAVTRSPDPAPDGGPAWRGAVTDLVTGEAVAVRDLWAPGTELTSPMVWSEVFADCDAPPHEVAWSDLALVGADGVRRSVTEVRTSYQAVGDGGCTTSDSSVDDDRFVQATGVARRTPAGAALALATGDR